MTTIDSFSEMLKPLSESEFLASVLGRRPMHIPGPSGRFASLLSWGALNEILLCHRQVDHLSLRIALNADIVPPAAYTHRSEERLEEQCLQLDVVKLNHLLREGASIVLNKVQELHAPVSALCRTMEWSLHTSVEACAFAGWHGVQGLPVHWDSEDVFVAQVEGTKHWTLREPAFKHPLAMHRDRLQPPESVYWEGDLQPGDLLYMPRGWWHCAVPNDQPSLHVSFAIRPPTGLDLIMGVLRRLPESELVRTAVPRFASEEAQAQYLSGIRSSIATLMDQVTVKDYLRVIDSVAKTRGALSLPWAAMPGQSLPDHFWLHWMPPRPAPLVESDREVILDVMGSQFRFANIAAPVIRDLMSCRRVTVGDLCARHAHADVQEFLTDLIAANLVAVSANRVI